MLTDYTNKDISREYQVAWMRTTVSKSQRQHLSELHPARLYVQAGNPECKDRISGREVRRSAPHLPATAAIRDPAATARRHLDQSAIPAVIGGLYTRWFNPWALIVGWAAGIVSGTWMAATTHFDSAIFPFVAGGIIVPGYAALYALTINFGVSVILSWLLNPIGATQGSDETRAADYRFASTSAS
jgi:hypothetical protein